eukprot:767743-Hanusia_phi.AAC.3
MEGSSGVAYMGGNRMGTPALENRLGISSHGYRTVSLFSFDHVDKHQPLPIHACCYPRCVLLPLSLCSPLPSPPRSAL